METLNPASFSVRATRSASSTRLPATKRPEIVCPMEERSATDRRLRLSDKEMNSALSTGLLDESQSHESQSKENWCRELEPAPTSRAQKVVSQLVADEMPAGDYGWNLNSTCSVESCSAFSHFQSCTARSADCTRSGFPPFTCTDFTLPLASTTASSFTVPTRF